jgi:hypothetical protein
MLTRSILLGGAIALALAGAGVAQQASDKTSTDQTQPMDKTQSNGQAQPDQDAAKTVHHYRHHARHHIRTAMLHRPSTPTERRATAQLNQQQLQMAGPQYAQGPGYAPAPQPAAYPAPTGENTGITPTNRIPNGTPYQTLTPAGGREDTPVMDQAHPR